jgi:hypothetical protein
MNLLKIAFTLLGILMIIEAKRGGGGGRGGRGGSGGS